MLKCCVLLIVSILKALHHLDLPFPYKCLTLDLDPNEQNSSVLYYSSIGCSLAQTDWHAGSLLQLGLAITKWQLTKLWGELAAQRAVRVIVVLILACCNETVLSAQISEEWLLVCRPCRPQASWAPLLAAVWLCWGSCPPSWPLRAAADCFAVGPARDQKLRAQIIIHKLHKYEPLT